MKKPDITATTIEEFNELLEYYDELPEVIKSNVIALSKHNIFNILVKMQSCSHPRNTSQNAFYVPPGTQSIDVKEEEKVIKFYGEDFLFEASLFPCINGYSLLQGEFLNLKIERL